jgi:hypothetical protein
VIRRSKIGDRDWLSAFHSGEPLEGQWIGTLHRSYWVVTICKVTMRKLGQAHVPSRRTCQTPTRQSNITPATPHPDNANSTLQAPGNCTHVVIESNSTKLHQAPPNATCMQLAISTPSLISPNLKVPCLFLECNKLFNLILPLDTNAQPLV